MAFNEFLKASYEMLSVGNMKAAKANCESWEMNARPLLVAKCAPARSALRGFGPTCVCLAGPR